MAAKLSFAFLLCVLQASTIFANANVVINEYAPIFFDIHLGLEQRKLSFAFTEVNFRKTVSNITEDVQQSISEIRAFHKAQIEENTAAVTCNPNKEQECNMKKIEEIANNLDTASFAAVRTCIGVFSKPVNEELNRFAGYYEQIMDITANITDVNEFCTQSNATIDEMRLCFFNKLAFIRLPLAEEVLDAAEKHIRHNVSSAIDVSKIKLTNCANLVAKDLETKAKSVMNNYGYCCK